MRLIKFIVMFLIINTTPQDYLEVILAQSNKILRKRKKSKNFFNAENLVPLLDNLLKVDQGELSQLSGLGVVTGPGSFSSIRTALTVARVLAWILELPLVGIKREEFTDNQDLVDKIYFRLTYNPSHYFPQPYYGKEPNITQRKKKLIR